MDPLSSWTKGSHTAHGITHQTYRKGSGPGVVIIHEIPGLTPMVIAFAEEVVDRGFTVVLPSMFGTPAKELSMGAIATSFASVCVRSEFTKLAMNRTAPATLWLRSLATELHEECGGPGVGALGMCFTGGFALGMLAGAPVAAPVLSQPSTPLPLGKKRASSLDLSDDDFEKIKAKGCEVLGLRYSSDIATGTRFDTLRDALGNNFIAVEFEGKGHSVLTEDRQQEGVDRVLDFFDEKLK